MDENFIEVERLEDANAVSLEKYRFIDFSEHRNRYIFFRRRGK